MIDATVYSFLVGLCLAIVSVVLYFKLGFSAREIEKHRMAAQEQAEERKLKLKNIGWNPSELDGTDETAVSLSKKEYLFITGGSFLLIALIGFALQNFFIAIAGGIVAYSLPKHLLKRARKQQYKLKVKLLKPALQSIASAHSFKPNIVSAIQYSIDSMQDPIKKDFELFLSDIEMGLPTEQALNALRKRVNVKYLDFFIKVVQMAQDEGGNTHELIKTSAEIIDQDMLTMEEFEAEIHGEKRTTYMLLFFQLLMLTVMGITQPHALEIFTQTLVGQAFVFYLVLSSFIIYQISEKITDSSLEEVSSS